MLTVGLGLPHQKEKREELQRRQQGHDVAHFREEQEKRRNQDWIKERMKQKEAERKAREEVRAKLELDRQERLARQQSATVTTPTRDTGETPLLLGLGAVVFTFMQTTYHTHARCSTHDKVTVCACTRVGRICMYIVTHN